MGNHMVRRVIMAICLLAILPAIIMIFVWSIGGSRAVSPEVQKKSMQEYTEKLNQRNADIIFYKKDPVGPSNLKARRVNALNDQGLALNLYSDKAYHVIILYDLDGSLDIHDQEIQKLKSLLLNDHFRIVYLGTMHYNQLVAGEILSKKNDHDNTAKSYITFVNKSNMRSSVEGKAFADDPQTMPITSGLTDEEVLVYTMIVELARKDLYWN